MTSPIILDIETVPATATPGVDLAELVAASPAPEPPRNYSKPETIAKWQAENHEDHYRKGVFRFADCKVVSVGLWWDGEGEVINLWEYPDERSMIREALAFIGRRNREVITFGDYDPRVLRAKAIQYDVAARLWSVTAKPWDRKVIDMQRLYAEALNGRGSDTKGVSVDALCEWLGIERANNPISGAGVLDAYLESRFADIDAHCLADVRDEAALWDRLGVVL